MRLDFHMGRFMLYICGGHRRRDLGEGPRSYPTFLKEEIRKEPGRRHFVRAFVSREGNRYYGETSGPQGSGILRSAAKANGLIIIPEDREIMREGEKAKVQLLDEVFVKE